MTRAIVIKTSGDPAMCGAIVDGITQKVIPLDSRELAHCRAELAVMRNRDSKYWERKIEEAEILYGTNKEHGKLYNALLIAWAGLCEEIRSYYDYFESWWVS